MAVFNHVGHCVTDLDRSRRFYEELLGFTFQRDLKVPDDPTGKLLRLSPPVGLTAVYLVHGTFVLELLHFDRPDSAPRARADLRRARPHPPVPHRRRPGRRVRPRR